MPNRSSTINAVDTLRLSKREHESLLEQLGRRTTVFNGDDARTDSRKPYEVENGLVIELEHPGGTRVALLVKPRNLSSKGIGFVHGSFLYVGSHCSVTLKARDGKLAQITGKVARCAYLHGRVHEIGVKFDEPLKLSEYVACASTPAPPPVESKQDF